MRCCLDKKPARKMCLHLHNLRPHNYRSPVVPEAALVAVAEAVAVMNVVAGGTDDPAPSFTHSFTDMPSAVAACRAALAVSAPAITCCADRYRDAFEEPYLAASSAYYRQKCAAVWPPHVTAAVAPPTLMDVATDGSWAIHRVHTIMREEEARVQRYLQPRASAPVLRVLLQRLVGEAGTATSMTRLVSSVLLACRGAPAAVPPEERWQTMRRLHEMVHRLAGRVIPLASFLALAVSALSLTCIRPRNNPCFQTSCAPPRPSACSRRRRQGWKCTSKRWGRAWWTIGPEQCRQTTAAAPAEPRRRASTTPPAAAAAAAVAVAQAPAAPAAAPRPTRTPPSWRG